MTGKGHWTEGTTLERSGSKTRESEHKRMRALYRLNQKHSEPGQGEAMALRMRCEALYATFRRDTDSDLRGAGVLLAALLEVHPVTLSRWKTGKRSIGKRVWSTLRMAEIAMEHDPQAVVDWCRFLITKKQKTTYKKR